MSEKTITLPDIVVLPRSEWNRLLEEHADMSSELNELRSTAVAYEQLHASLGAVYKMVQAYQSIPPIWRSRSHGVPDV